MGTVRDQLQNKTFDDLQAKDMKSAVGKAYLNASEASEDAQSIMHGWGATHTPVYGQPIPYGIEISSTTMSGATTDLATPADNEVWRIIGMSAQNAGGAEPVVITIDLYDEDNSKACIVAAAVPVLPSGNDPVSFATSPSIWVDKNTHLRCTVVSGTQADMTVTVAYARTCQ